MSGTRLGTLQPPVLLASASYAGTIAAVRNLGRNGVEVRIIKNRYFLDAAAWSRFASRSYQAPPETDSARFLKRLLAIGAADPGQLLLPTSDETAWLYSVNSGLLKEHYSLYQPPVATMRRILDKKLFADAATAAGVPVLPYWDPQNLDELTSWAPTLPYPILIKPRTHVHGAMSDKGIVVGSASELIEQYKKYVSAKEQSTADPLLHVAATPILQRFVNVGREGVRSVAGFINRAGNLFVARHATKVFQRTRPVGVGVCFEPAPHCPILSAAVRQLCASIGFFGVFEIEFLWFDGRWNAIDFNPRLFNQMGMDIYRGAPLPFLAYLDAAGKAETLREAVLKAQNEENHSSTVLYDQFTLRAILFAKTLTLQNSNRDRAYWRDWIKQNKANSIDIVFEKNDPMPGLIHVLSEMRLGIKALPQFLRANSRVSPTKLGAFKSVWPQ